MARRIQSGQVLKPTNDITLVEKLDLRPVSVGGVQKFLAVSNQPVDLSSESAIGLYTEPIIEANSFVIEFTGNAETLVCHVIPECEPTNPPIEVKAYYDVEKNVTIFSASQIHSETQPGPFSKIEIQFLDSSKNVLIKSFRSDTKKINVGSALVTIKNLTTPFPLNGTCISYVSEGEMLEGANIGDFIAVDANYNTEHMLCLVEGVSPEKRWIKNPNGSDENIEVTDWVYGLRIISGAPRKSEVSYHLPYPGDEANVGEEVEFELTVKIINDQLILDVVEGMLVRLDSYDDTFHYIAQILEISEKIGKVERVEGAIDNPDPTVIIKAAILSKGTMSINSPINIKYYQWKIGSATESNVTACANGDLTGLTLAVIYNEGQIKVFDDNHMTFIYNAAERTSTATCYINVLTIAIEAALVVPIGTKPDFKSIKNASVAQVFCNTSWGY